ncbi:MAG: NAD(P)H-dependent oxidoreductase subunit E [Candidatus Muiribacterium halophilum]|uniref:NAD(P)H-dependent oxidoreductase subunit E n=1 Tax=Muiribacterium halophilum TaxID=2053465 RepID=A0A2N5ZFP2_MUIH1|nr:MAG: NAD(P)H-dependent oxidoreductase subunit E [Candidatus Muirbacterium halophilum]
MVCSCENGKETDFSLLDNIIEENRDNEGILINVLHKAQTHYGALTPQIQKRISEGLNIPLSEVYGTITFYHFFTMVPKGKYVVKICTGTACYVRGANKLVEQFSEKLGIEVGGTTDDGLFSLETVRCVGACSLAPVVTVNDEDIFKRVSAKEIDDIIAKYK